MFVCYSVFESQSRIERAVSLVELEKQIEKGRIVLLNSFKNQ